MNYKMRYLIETTDADSPERVIDAQADDSRVAEGLAAIIAAEGRPATIIDRGTQHRASTPAGARARGYYGMRYSGTDIENYVLGKIEAAADEALDSLDILVEEKEFAFETRHRNSWLRADQNLILWAGTGKAVA
jgi:hypothetical protein